MLFWAQFTLKWGQNGPQPKWKTFFFGRNDNSRSSVFRNFFLSKYQMFWILFYSCVIFSLKKVQLPAKTFLIWVFRTLFSGKTALGVRWLVWKFFLVFTQTGPEFWPKKAQIWTSLKNIILFLMAKVYHYCTIYAALKIKILLLPANWSLRPWSRSSSYLLQWSRDYCFDLAGLF